MDSKSILDEIVKNETLSQLFYVRMVVTKVNMNNIYQSPHHGVNLGIFNLGIEGYSQTVLLDKFENVEEDVNQMFSLVSRAIPQQNVFRILNNIGHPSLAKSILCSSKFHNEANKFNRVKYSTLYGKIGCKFNSIL